MSFFGRSFQPRLGPPVPADDKWEITQVAPGAPPLFADKFDYPISTTFVIQLAKEADRWYVLAACPKAETAAATSTVARARAEGAERARVLAAGIDPRLRQNVRRLVREGRKIGAIMEYQKASGEDLATAKEVVESLLAENR